MDLLIVESPAKCKTIGNYLGSNYIVESSIGHIRDLSIKGKGGFGVDIDNNFAPEYVILKDKVEIVEKLKSLQPRLITFIWQPTPIVKERQLVGI